MRRAFSMETLPREMIYGGGLEGGVNPIYIPAYPSIANQIEESALKNMAMPTKQEIQQFQEMLIRRVREAQEQILPGQDYRYYGYETYDDEEEDFEALLQASQAGLLGGVSSMMHSLAPPIENQNWDQAKLEMRSEATSGPMQVPGISLTGSFNMRYPPVGAGATPISARLPKSSRKRAPPQIVTSDESSLEDHLVPHPMTHPLPELMSSQQRQPPIGQCSPDVPSVAIETQAAMLPMKLHSNSYLGDFDNLRIPPEFLPSRNRGLLKSLKG